MGREIRQGTLDAPSWEYIRTANTARRLYAPLGTRLGLGDHVRLTQRFVDAFAGKRAVKGWSEGVDPKAALKTPMVGKAEEGTAYFGAREQEGEKKKELGEEGPHTAAELDALAKDLKVSSLLVVCASRRSPSLLYSLWGDVFLFGRPTR